MVSMAVSMPLIFVPTVEARPAADIVMANIVAACFRHFVGESLTEEGSTAPKWLVGLAHARLIQLPFQCLMIWLGVLPTSWLPREVLGMIVYSFSKVDQHCKCMDLLSSSEKTQSVKVVVDTPVVVMDDIRPEMKSSPGNSHAAKVER